MWNLNTIVPLFPITTNYKDFEDTITNKSQTLKVLSTIYNSIDDEYEFVKNEREKKINFLEGVKLELLKHSKGNGIVTDIDYLPLKQAFEIYNALSLPLELLDDKTLENLFSNVYEVVIQLGLYDLLRKYNIPISKEIKLENENEIYVYLMFFKVINSIPTISKIKVITDSTIDFQWLQDYFGDKGTKRLNDCKEKILNKEKGICTIYKSIKDDYVIEGGVAIVSNDKELKKLLKIRYKQIINEIKKKIFIK